MSSRRQKNVDNAVDSLKSEGLDAFGLVCHNGKEDDMKRLISEVTYISLSYQTTTDP